MSKKKKTKRKSLKNKQEKFYVKKSHSPRVRHELYDADYLHLLSPEELAWHNKFTSEYVNAAIKKNKKNKKVKKGHLHNNKELAKSCYDANNRRNNDLYGVTKANGLLSMDLQNIVKNGEDWTRGNPASVEDALIAYIDNKDKLKSDKD